MPDQSPQHPYQLVTFDIGGVLIRICHTWEAAAEVAKVPIRLPAGGATPLADMPGFDEYQAGTITVTEYLERLGEWLGCSTSEAERLHNGILVEPYGGTEELVAELQGAGVATGCLSNTNEPHWHEFFSGRFPAVARLDRKMASHLVGMNKPDSRIFELHAEINHVAPAEVVYFDDHPGNVEAAANVGFRSFRIDPNEDTVLQMRGFLGELGVLPSPSEL